VVEVLLQRPPALPCPNGLARDLALLYLTLLCDAHVAPSRDEPVDRLHAWFQAPSQTAAELEPSVGRLALAARVR